MQLRESKFWCQNVKDKINVFNKINSLFFTFEILLEFKGGPFWLLKWMQKLIVHEALFVCDLGKVKDY